MSTENRTYIAIDLKSFYASAECVERGLDPLKTNLVVADESRTEKTICLAVSPSLKEYGIPGRPRLFEVIQRVEQVNNDRLRKAGISAFNGESFLKDELDGDPSLKLSYITALPRMAMYKNYSSKIFSIYLRYVSSEDIHIYSVDEVFMDITDYLGIYQMTPHELTIKMIRDVLKETGITATAGIGTNMYLCKIAMDIVAKHMEPDADGVRIAELDEQSYRQLLWDHRPLKDFWRIGRGYSERLASCGLFTMGDIARCSIENEDILYRLFGINAELLIDHAWGYEPCTMEAIKSYVPENNSLSSGQVLKEPYTIDKARIILREMADSLSLELMRKNLVTDQIIVTLGYDRISLHDPDSRAAALKEGITSDHYGRAVPKHAHGSENLKSHTMTSSEIIRAALSIFDRVAVREFFVRRINIAANHVMPPDKVPHEDDGYEQLDLFSMYPGDGALDNKTSEHEKKRLEKEKAIQQAVLEIKNRYGGNAILKGTSFMEGATGRERNEQVGGHRA
ncbi:MAG: DNA methylase [Lachnospiraceae bacterium]|nr:DNA methylase [Lachnospiraceae bacterium]